MTTFDKYPQIVKDCLDAIHNDSWMYIVVWGEPRTGKSTFCQVLMHKIYKDWEKVLAANVFNLNQMLYNLKNGIPELWPTRNKLHMRIPILNFDDFAVHSGKARTQHERCWDVMKGGWDALGTKIGVLLVNMVSPRSSTQQLQEKYTHEIWVYKKGHYKYDRCKMMQDYRGFQANIHKDWIDEGSFERMPMDKFKQYDEQRMSLADEVLQIAEDSLVETHMGNLIKRVPPIDVNFLRYVNNAGLVHMKGIDKEFGGQAKAILTRCKSRGLVVARRMKGQYYKYDITELGSSFLKEKDKEELVVTTTT